VLAPIFVTTFERTSWLVRRRDGSVVEVALDVGQIAVGDKKLPPFASWNSNYWRARRQHCSTSLRRLPAPLPCCRRT
jgi:hypothetical protein